MSKIGGAIALGAGLGGLYLLTRKKEKPPTEGINGGASILIGTIIDAKTGQPVPHNSPDAVLEGGTYILPFTIRNGSTRLGALVDANLGVIMAGIAGLVGISFPVPWEAYFIGGQTLSWNITFTVPDGTGGTAGEIRVRVNDPNGVQLALGIKALTIQSAAIIYGATVTIGVI